MPKACLNCGTENRNEALFCRRCGTPFSSEHASPSTAEPTLPGSRAPASALSSSQAWSSFPAPATSVFDDDDDEQRLPIHACPTCGFANRPDAPACENCGAPLSASADAAATLLISRPPGALRPSLPQDELKTVILGSSRSAEKDTVAPATSRQSTADPDTLPFDPALPTATPRPPTMPAADGGPLRMWLAIAVAVVLLIVAAYWYLNPRPSVPAKDASAPAASASAADTAAATLAPETAAAPPPQTAATPDPAESIASAPLAAASTAASAAEDAARTAKDKADKAARVKALREQREQAATAKKAEQDAAAERAAGETARAGAAPSVPPSSRPDASAAAGSRPQSAAETCAGRGTIGTAVCESRECGKPEHVNEPRCRQVNAEEERRR